MENDGNNEKKSPWKRLVGLLPDEFVENIKEKGEDIAITELAKKCSADFSSLENVETYLMGELKEGTLDLESFGAKIIQELKGDNKENAKKVMNWALAYLAQTGDIKNYEKLHSYVPQGMTFDIDGCRDQEGKFTFPVLTSQEIQVLDFNKSLFEQPLGLLNFNNLSQNYPALLTALGNCTPDRLKSLVGALGTFAQSSEKFHLPPVLGQIQRFLDPNASIQATPSDENIPDLSGKVITDITEFSACQGKNPMDLANRAFAAINRAPEEEQEGRFLNFYQNLLQAKDLAPDKAEDIEAVLPLLKNLYTARFDRPFPEEAVQQATPKHPFLALFMPIINAIKEFVATIISFFIPESKKEEQQNTPPVTPAPNSSRERTSTPASPAPERPRDVSPAPENQQPTPTASQGNSARASASESMPVSTPIPPADDRQNSLHTGRERP